MAPADDPASPRDAPAWLRRLEDDPQARERLFRVLWYVSAAFTAFGFVVIAILLRRQGVL